MYDMKALYEAETGADACRLLDEHPEAVIIAGGSDVLIQMREGRLAGKELISIYGADELRGISMEEDGTLRIGALTSFSHIHKDPLINQHIKVLGDAVNMVGSPQVRAIGTIGGNTCNGVTSADSASTCMAYDVIMEIQGPAGLRQVPIAEWYLGPKKTVLQHNEILRAVLVPKKAYEGYQGVYMKYGMRNAMEIATTGCSVNVKLTPDKKNYEDVRCGFGVAAPVPIRSRHAEAFIKGQRVSEENIRQFARTVLMDVTPRDSWRASKSLRLHICTTMAERALREATALCGGEF